jgi:hypothetical protein
LPQSTILRRMDMLGFTEQALANDYQTYGAAWIRDFERPTSFEWGSVEDNTSHEGSAAYLRNLLASGVDALLYPAWSAEGAQLAEDLTSYWIDEYEAYPSESTVIRTALRAFRPTDKVFAAISQQALFELMPNGIEWLEDEFPKPSSLGGHRTELAWRNTKPIVLLEGTFDSQVIKAAFEVRFPEFADCLSIADFTQGTEGGTGGLRRTLRTLAQLEIPNTILGLFDNDTAGREALDLLGKDDLPINIGYSCYPDLEFACSYPTIGPTGPARSDINRRALSIELFLGSDCLMQNGRFLPVEWTGYNRRILSYQGSIADKAVVQSAFRKKVARARNRKPSPDDDWSSLDRLGQFVIEQISEIASRRSVTSRSSTRKSA